MHRALLIMLVLPLAGCGLELLGATAIQSGMQAENARQATQALRHVQGTTDRVTAERAIDAYRAEHGQNPPSLEVLVTEGYLAGVPAQPDGTAYGYDPATGTLTSGGAPTDPAPATPTHGPAPSDQQQLASLRQAIQAYWNDRGAYPPSLYALVPTYLDVLPESSSGRPFTYDAQTGAVSAPGAPPSEARPQPQPRQRHGAGTTPMVEGMTGLGAQQELNRMGHGGSNRAGTHSRQQGQSIPDAHTQRQMDAMDELGL
jgi:hypothetical protein